MNVLVVDDDVVSRMVLMHLVDSLGPFDIAEAEDGQEAWEQLQGGARPAICFCDLRMPRLSGMELLQRVKADPGLKSIAFVMVSSANEVDVVGAASAAGAAGYIIKPFDAEQVRKHLARLSAPAAPAVDAGAAEAPPATMQRLGINGERLLAYLAGFQNQLDAAALELPALLGDGTPAARMRIERLQTGCQTLGLHGAAALLRALAVREPDAAALRQALETVSAAVAQQTQVARRHFAPA